MNRLDQTTSWLRTWSERHPVLSEFVGLIIGCSLAIVAMLMLFYAL